MFACQQDITDLVAGRKAESGVSIPFEDRDSFSRLEVHIQQSSAFPIGDKAVRQDGCFLTTVDTLVVQPALPSGPRSPSCIRLSREWHATGFSGPQDDQSSTLICPTLDDHLAFASNSDDLLFSHSPAPVTGHHVCAGPHE